MGPIDIRYHVVSLVAVFLALGVGIIVGSNTHLVGTNTLIEKQNAIIQRVERDAINLRNEMQTVQSSLKDNQKYTAQLEQETVPLLMEGKLSEARFGAIIIGTLPEGSNEAVVLGPMKKSAAQISYKVLLSLESLESMADGKPDLAMKRMAAELLYGNQRSSEFTRKLVSDGSLLFGDFTEPVQGVVFLLGGGIDAARARALLVPLEGYIRLNKGIVANAMLGADESIEDILRRPSFPVYTDARELIGQSRMIAEIGNQLRERSGGANK